MKPLEFSSPPNPTSRKSVSSAEKKFNDIRLALLSIRASHGMTLTEFNIRAAVIQPFSSSSSFLSVTDMGLKIISFACSDLKRLALSGSTRIGREGLAAIASRSPKLEQLVISSCPAVDDDALISFANNCPNLSLLNLDRCPLLTDRSLKAFSSHHIKTFSLSRCPGVTSSVLTTDFSSLCSLSKIAISSCPALTDCNLSVLRDNKLETLKLEKCHAVTFHGVALALQNASQTLKSLSLVNCCGPGRDDTVSTMFLSQFPKLWSLEISNCPGIGDELLLSIARSMPGLRRITLRAADAVTDTGLVVLLKHCRRLSMVDLSQCRQITDVSVITLANSVNDSLISLAMEECKLVTDMVMAAVARLCPNLAELDLTGCQRITDSGVEALAWERPCSLELLSLEGCDKITDVSLHHLEEIAECGSLVSINLKHCPRLSSTTVHSIHRRLWWCDLIS